jgi:hypothetical protein
MISTHTVILFVIRAQSDCDARSKDGGERSIMLIIEIAYGLCAVAEDAEDTPQRWHGRLTRAPGPGVARDGRGSSWKRRLLCAILLIGLVCLFALQGCAGLAVSESSSPMHGQSLAYLPIVSRRAVEATR